MADVEKVLNPERPTATRMANHWALFERGCLLMEYHHVPGVASGLSKDGRHAKGPGITSVGQPSPVHQHPLSLLASSRHLSRATATMRIGRIRTGRARRTCMPVFSGLIALRRSRPSWASARPRLKPVPHRLVASSSPHWTAKPTPPVVGLRQQALIPGKALLCRYNQRLRCSPRRILEGPGIRERRFCDFCATVRAAYSLRAAEPSLGRLPPSLAAVAGPPASCRPVVPRVRPGVPNPGTWEPSRSHQG